MDEIMHSRDWIFQDNFIHTWTVCLPESRKSNDNHQQRLDKARISSAYQRQENSARTSCRA